EAAVSDTTICLEIGGTAEMGVDYSWIDNCVTIQTGYDTAMIHIHPLYDGIIEGNETIKFTIANKNGETKSCDSTEVVIEDYLNMTTTTNTDPFICVGQLTPLWVNVSNGYPPYTYFWEPGSFTNDTIFVSPEETTLYTVNVIDHLQDTIADQVTVSVLPADLNDILSFSFEAENNPGIIEDLTGQIFEDSVFVAIPENINTEGLVATFDISYCAEATVNGEPQQSSITPNDFTNPVIYEVMAQNGDIKEWKVVVDI
ncbi:MAG: hypothetical protein KDC05_16520, partial [Bacteroidales bacterium]|nr:hypothetical protein [Bacteroidales bacterium]